MDEKNDETRQYRAEMDIQRESDSLTSKGYFLQINIEPGGFVHITAAGPGGAVYHTGEYENSSLESAFMELEMDIERTRVMASFMKKEIIGH